MVYETRSNVNRKQEVNWFMLTKSADTRSADVGWGTPVVSKGQETILQPKAILTSGQLGYRDFEQCTKTLMVVTVAAF